MDMISVAIVMNSGVRMCVWRLVPADGQDFSNPSIILFRFRIPVGERQGEPNVNSSSSSSSSVIKRKERATHCH
jgi:hypothetical protein